MEWVLHALRLLAYRAQLNGREDITVDDIEWAIQELKRDIPADDAALTTSQRGTD